jgi:molybdopterin-guanine dinucleotide biosynthesis protein A
VSNGEISGPTGVILAGGKSTRFGSDKASALLRGRPLLQWVADALSPACSKLVMVAAQGQRLPETHSVIPTETITDRYDSLGPLAAMVTAFEVVGSDPCFVAACDVPLMEPKLVRYLLSLADGFDIACAKTGESLQPLAAVYRPATCLPVFRTRVEARQLKVISAYSDLRVRYVTGNELRDFDPDLRSFLNANEPEGLAEIERRLGKSAASGTSRPTLS